MGEIPCISGSYWPANLFKCKQKNDQIQPLTRVEISKMAEKMGVKGLEAQNPKFFKMVLAIISIESSWNANAVNTYTGAEGLMQMLPSTAIDILSKLNPKNPEDKAILDVLDPILSKATGLKETLGKIRQLYEDAKRINEKTPEESKKAQDRIRDKIFVLFKVSSVLIGSRGFGLLKDPVFSISMGVLYLAKLSRKSSDPAGRAALRDVLRTYSGSSLGNKAYEIKIFKLMDK